MTISIIAMLAGLTLGALQAARQTACEARTKALITKLNHVIVQRYESYLTRRVPVNTRVVPPNDPQYMVKVARLRLDGVRDLMRMEMPERWADVLDEPLDGRIPRPAISYVYKRQLEAAKVKYPDSVVAEFGPAECLYMIIALGMPEAMENFSPSDIGDADGDGLPEFQDGWGRPIMFLRWAPGFDSVSEIQIADPVNHHDPFDTRHVDPGAYHLIPLIYSGGRDKEYDIEVDYREEGKAYHYRGNPYESPAGTPVDEDGDGLNHYDNIHNHYMAQE